MSRGRGAAALQQAQALGEMTIRQGDLQDFVDRIEVLYALSQFLRDESTDLPGSQYLAPWLKDAQLKFEGAKWQQRRKKRRYSTALSAPINYGPGLKMLGWVMPHPEYPGVMIPNPTAAPALDALETQIAAALGHEAFNEFGSVTVATDDARQWGDLWALDEVTDVEAKGNGRATDRHCRSGKPATRRETDARRGAPPRHHGYWTCSRRHDGTAF